MFDIPMQLTEEKKSNRQSSNGFAMCCEKCVFGSGVHSCIDFVNTVDCSMCECGHPIEAHSDVGCQVLVSASPWKYCECSITNGQTCDSWNRELSVSVGVDRDG